MTALVGAKYFQELAPGVAMDRAEHVSMQAVARTPAGTFRRCLKVRETTPLEPDVSLKKYARGRHRRGRQHEAHRELGLTLRRIRRCDPRDRAPIAGRGTGLRGRAPR
ncbi:MAG TPA: hypothetical protein VK387_09210 [Thermoleophilaceae bacterium]|nr:hypothetical protein [Thermoleophilaceae bacterium]